MESSNLISSLKRPANVQEENVSFIEEGKKKRLVDLSSEDGFKKRIGGKRTPKPVIPVYIAENEKEYRRLVPKIVREKDIVIEIGCHEGLTTALIHKVTTQIIGIDLSERNISIAKQRYEKIRFEVCDAKNISQIMSFARDFNPKGGGVFDVIFFDISGSRDLGTVCPLIEKYEAALKPRCLVVKNYRLHRLRHQLVTLDELECRNEKDDDKEINF